MVVWIFERCDGKLEVVRTGRNSAMVIAVAGELSAASAGEHKGLIASKLAGKGGERDTHVNKSFMSRV